MIHSTEVLGTLLPTIVAVVIGLIIAWQQCRQLAERLRTYNDQKRRRGSNEKDEVEDSQEQKRQLQELSRLRRHPSFENLAQELERMKRVQRDVKNQLAGLRLLVDQASTTRTNSPAR